MEYDFEENRIVKELNEKDVKRILIQLPQGLKKEAFRLVNLIKEKCKVEIIISGSGCWGGCDLAIDEAKKVKADLLVHFGHAPFVAVDFPVLYVELYSKLRIIELLKAEINKLNFGKVGLVGAIQYVKQFDEIKSFLEKSNKEVFIPSKKGFAAYDGHVVGCEYNSLKTIEKNVDGFLVIGNKFHSLGAALMCVDKPVWLLNEQSGKLELMSDERDIVIKKRAIAIDKVRNCSKIGIVVDKKIGQYNFKIAEVLRDKFLEQNKEVLIILVDEFNPSLMNFYDVDAFIDTACPRIAFEDFDRYDKTIITSREAKVVLGEKSWEDLLEKGLIGFV